MAETPLIQAQSGERSFSISTEAVQAIAVNGRTFNTLTNLAPGVVAGTVNGLRVNQNTLQIDGITSVDTGQQRQRRDADGGRGAGSPGPDHQLPGRVRPLRGRADQRGHQERHAAVSRVRLCRPAQGRPQLQHVAERTARSAKAEDQPVGSGLHDRRSGRPSQRPLAVLLLPQPGMAAGAQCQQRDACAGADGARTAWRLLADARQRGTPLQPDSRSELGAAMHGDRYPRLLCRRRRARAHPAEPSLRPRPSGAEHVPAAQQHGDRKPGLQLRQPGFIRSAAPSGPDPSRLAGLGPSGASTASGCTPAARIPRRTAAARPATRPTFRCSDRTIRARAAGSGPSRAPAR